MVHSQLLAGLKCGCPQHFSQSIYQENGQQKLDLAFGEINQDSEDRTRILDPLLFPTFTSNKAHSLFKKKFTERENSALGSSKRCRLLDTKEKSHCGGEGLRPCFWEARELSYMGKLSQNKRKRYNFFFLKITWLRNWLVIWLSLPL